jgi:hypothetical protein
MNFISSISEFSRRSNWSIAVIQRKGNIRSIQLLSVVNLFWLIGYYPGAFPKDGIQIWNQALFNQYSDWHPVINALFLKVFSFNCVFPAGISIVQTLLMDYCIFLLISKLRPKYSFARNIFITSLIMLTPFAGSFAVTVIKDTPYTILSLVGIILIFSNSSRRWNLPLGASILMIGSLFRQEGFVISTGCFLVLLIYIFVKRFTSGENHVGIKITVTLGICALVGAIALPLLGSMVNSSPTPPWFKYSPLLADLAYVADTSPSSISTKDYNSIKAIFKDNSLSTALNCRSFNDLLNSGFDENYASKSANSIPSIWLRTLKSTAGNDMMKFHFCRGSQYVIPPFASVPNFEASGMPVPWTYFGIWKSEDAQLAYPNARNFKLVGLMINTWRQFWMFNGEFLAWPGLHMLLILLLAPYFYYTANKSVVLGIVLFCFVRNTYSMWFTAGPDYRYALSTHIVSVTLLLIVIVDILPSVSKALSKIGEGYKSS